MYRVNPTLDNWNAFRHEVIRCRRILRREKRAGWKHLCSSFTCKTPTADVWRFMRSYKKKSLAKGCLHPDDNTSTDMQDSVIDKLCSPSCLHVPIQFSNEMNFRKCSVSDLLLKLDNQFTPEELEAVIASAKRGSAPGLDQIDYDIIRALSLHTKLILLSIFNEMFEQGLFPHDWRTFLVIFVPKTNSWTTSSRINVMPSQDFRENGVS